MTATPPALTDRPVQLTLDLWAGSERRRCVVRRPYWDQVDLADHGGELHARRPGIRALLSAQRRSDGAWVGYHDLVLRGGGSNGATRPQSARTDALASAAYELSRYCHRLLGHAPHEPKDAVTGARQVLRWLDGLGVL
jgi:hypothetical protein